MFDENAGWKIDGKGKPVTTIENVNKNITLVGTWKFIPVLKKVTFKDGENTIATVEVEVGKTIEGDSLKNQSMPKNPTKAGYTFKEWNTKADGTGDKFLGTTAVTSDITVYAVYTKDSNTEDPQDSHDPNNNSENGSSLDLDNGSEEESNHKSSGNQSNNVNAQNRRDNKSKSLESTNSNQTNDSANSNKRGVVDKLGTAMQNTLPRTGVDNSLALSITAIITTIALTTLLTSLIAKSKK
ncbi:InlB B-repeat-containing protein [Gardnerella sp. DNF00257]